MTKKVLYILGLVLLTLTVSCKSSRHAKGGEVVTKNRALSNKQRMEMPAPNAQGYIDVQQLRIIEYRIKFYKDRIKEAKKNKQMDRVEVYKTSMKRYQRLRRQMTTLYVRIVRDLQSDF